MNLLYPHIPTALGLLLQTASTWLAAFTPWLIGIVCVIALIIMAAVPCWIKAAKEIDEILEFPSPTWDEDNRNQNERKPNERNVIPNKT